MNPYRCAVCGAAAYSSANSDTVGACPACGTSLGEPRPSDAVVAPAGPSLTDLPLLPAAEAPG
jgi:DNA-directed RNA polymerase subunit RPC12/RpoP